MDNKQKQRRRAKKKEEQRNARRAKQKSVGLRINRRFNRVESKTDNFYCNEFGGRPIGTTQTPGWIKCRLVHGRGYSLVVPELLFLEQGQQLRWIQPLQFLSNLLTRTDDDIHAQVCVDISCGETVKVTFARSSFLKKLEDGSELYACRIEGPANLQEFATGDAIWGPEGTPFIRLFHHTTATAQGLILDGKHFRTGDYSIQGTTKKLANVAYAYFTPLDSIQTDNDLQQIAMAKEGEITLMRDGFTPPRVLMSDWKTRFADDILVLPVFPSDLNKREARVDVLVDVAVLGPQQLYRHAQESGVFYAFSHPFIHRVGTNPGARVVFDDQRRITQQANLRKFEYLVVGDCSTLDGLRAPYDEEDTRHIMKFEDVPKGQTILAFWFQRANTDLFSPKSVQLQTFKPAGGESV
jgi:hypothetical protein